MLLAFLKTVVDIFVALVSISFWPILFLFTIANELCRWFLQCFILESRFQIQSGDGNFALSRHIYGRMVVTALYSETSVDFSKDISKDRKRFEGTVLNKQEGSKHFDYSKLKHTQVIKYGYSCLRDDSASFNISNHVKLFTGSEPRNGDYYTEQEFAEIILPHHLSNNMDESHPQWEWLLIPRLQRRDGSINSVRIFRWDHRYMDGASAGILLSEAVFDPWNTGHNTGQPPYIVDPKASPPNRCWLTLAKIWAWIHLPLVILVARMLYLFTPKKSPLATWTYPGTQSYSNPASIRIPCKGRQSMRNFLASSLCPVIYSLVEKMKKYDSSCSFTLNTLQALPPYKSSFVNQFTILDTPVSLEDCNNVTFKPGGHLFLASVYQGWLGRLPVAFLDQLLAPSDSSVVLNSIPFLRECGSLHGAVIQEMAFWDNLFIPNGLVVNVFGYGGKLFVTAFSAEGCLSSTQLEMVVASFITRLKNMQLNCDAVISVEV